MTTATNLAMHYSSRHHANDRCFLKAELSESESMDHLYGSQCRSYASNVREITQEDGSSVTGKQAHFRPKSNRDQLVVEYIFQNPSVTRNARSSPVTSSDDDRRSPRSKFAQIKAKFEKNSSVYVDASPSSSSRRSSQSNKKRREFNRKATVDPSSMEQIRVAPSPPLSISANHRSQSSLSEPSASGSSRYLDSVDETDEELQYFLRKGSPIMTVRSCYFCLTGEQRREIEEKLPLTQPIDHQQQQAPTQIEYEITDENGNTIVIDNVHDIIKASGIQAREVEQPDGTILKEYVIDDPQVASQIQAQRTTVSPSIPVAHEFVPPPPPRVIRKAPVFDSQTQPIVKPLPVNILAMDELLPRQHYQYITTSGRRIEFVITDVHTARPVDNRSELKELTNAIDARLPYTYVSHFTAPPRNILAREFDTVRRQRTVSNIHLPSHAGIANFPQQILKHAVLTRSASSGTLHPQDQFAPIITEPIIDWSILRQQDPDGQVDSELVRQFINQRHQVKHSQMSTHLWAQPTPVQATFYPQTSVHP